MIIEQLERTATLRSRKMQHATIRNKLRCNTVYHEKKPISKQYNKVQLEKRYNMKRVQHVKSAIRKKCNMK